MKMKLNLCKNLKFLAIKKIKTENKTSNKSINSLKDKSSNRKFI